MSRWMMLVMLAACGDVEGPSGDVQDQELITTVELGFTTGGVRSVFVWDGVDAGAPVVDDIELQAGTYALDVSFLNQLEDPAEDLTAEVRDEGTLHQVFFTGSVVEGAAPLWVVAYDDVDDNGLPIGLENTAEVGLGDGEFTVTLRHMPPESGEAVKVDGLAEAVAQDGFEAIGGDTDVQVTFAVYVVE